jgi:predicted metal-binding protein
MPKEQTQAFGVEQNQVQSDLGELGRMALQRGADDAVVIPSDRVILDPRVRFKCMIPKCYMSGGCEHCPPHGYSLDQVRNIVNQYQWAVFFRVKVPSTIIAAKGVGPAIGTGVMSRDGSTLNLGGYYILVFTIVKLLEKRAVQMGYAEPFGFAAGNCRDPLCHLQPVCQKLVTNQGCRNEELSSPSLESCGMDAFTMAAKQGWDVYPIGGTCQPDSLPHGSLMGLVLIA